MCFCLPGGSPRRSRAVHTASGWRVLCVLSHLFTTIDELGMSIFKVVCDNLGYSRLFVTRTIFSIPVQCELYFVKYGRWQACLGCKSCMTNCYANKKYVCPGLVCAYAHVRIISEKDFYKKNSFSPEGKFLQKNYVVLYCVKCINICMRRCVYAHMRTGLPDSVFFCLHNFLISQWWFCDAGDLSF